MSGPPSSSIPPPREAPAAAVDAALRRRLVRLACAPALVVALAATAAVTFLWSAGQPDAATAGAVPGDVAGPGTLAAVLLVAAAALAGGIRAASAQAAALNRRARSAPPAPAPGSGTVVEDGPGQRLRPADQVAVFVNLARRLQSLLHREIHVLDELENQVEDPDILKGVFQVDHLATRIRRYAENLAVLGGAVPRRQWTRPVQLTEILRSSAAEVEHYQRVRLVPPIEGTVTGQAVADVIHLLSELVENATFYSPPQTRVLLRASRVTAGLAIEVEDRGLGMTEQTQQRMNALLADPEGVDVGALLADGRIGLYVVGMLARRHGVAVQLRGNIYGGVQAVLVLPHAMLGDPQPASEHAPRAEQRAPHAPPSGAAPPRSAHSGTAPHPRSAHPAAAPHPGSAPPDGPGTPRPTPPAPAPAPAPVAIAAPVAVAGGPLPAAAGPDPAGPVPAAGPVPGGDPASHGPPPASGAARHGAAPASGPASSPPPPASGAAPYGPAPGGAPGPAAGPGGPEGGGERPRLPRRSRQQHLAPELRDAPTAGTPARRTGNAGGTGDAEDAVHDPGLMAAFRRGVGRADVEARGRPSPDGHGPSHQEEGRS
ncbi:ATP-binding protein [Streptomyces qinglanensis]|uniref:histidine kinase n=1 Tax=Streptomyces qinglanensis TaxID=943816 RepID=A0A1H9WXI6_9ACTN|nr:ATP-binding protein [Streptomyces qinglanensis]SES38491.1 hypothetical protein SAMN05421870_1248 [Streptomyces qinglanensis]